MHTYVIKMLTFRFKIPILNFPLVVEIYIYSCPKLILKEVYAVQLQKYVGITLSILIINYQWSTTISSSMPQSSCDPSGRYRLKKVPSS